MPEEFSQDRTEAPTPRRREDARRKGQVAQSVDLTNAALLVAGAAVLWLSSDSMGNVVIRMFREHLLTSARPEWTREHTVALAFALFGHLGTVLLPLLALLFLTAAAATGGQVGLQVNSEAMALDWSKIGITKGWAKLFSFRSLMRGVMSLLKLTLTIFALLWALRAHGDWIVRIGRQHLSLSLANTWLTSLWVAAVSGGILLALGLLDYLFQRWQHLQDLKMSRQEIRDEHKQEEGDPHVKSRLRKLQRETVKNQMLRAVPDATVVLTNPTHIAVALQYDRQTMAAPKVIAKGTDSFARRIVRVAREHDVPVLERKPLARALYASVEVNQDIPPMLYKAIAEILAHIFRMRRSA